MPDQCCVLRSWLEEVFESSMCLDDKCFDMFVKHGVKGVVFWQMCFREMAFWVQGNARRASDIVHQGSIEEGFTGWWCHLAAVCVLSCLYLLWDGHGASGDGGYPWVLWDSGCNT